MLRVIGWISVRWRHRPGIEVVHAAAQARFEAPRAADAAAHVAQFRRRVSPARLVTQWTRERRRRLDRDHARRFCGIPVAMRPLVFLHIPKAAGTSLRSVIRRNYPPHMVLAVESYEDSSGAAEYLQRGGAVTGHLSLHTYRALNIDADAITVLRDPIERLISLYFYARRRGPQHRFAAHVGSFEAFAACGFEDVHNGMTRQLSGTATAPDADALARAKHNLAHELVAFGTHDHFDESLLLFQQRFGWRTIYCARENAAKRRPAMGELDRNALRLVERNNELDAELWEFAQKELSARLAVQPGSFHDQLRAYRRRNRVYSAVVTSARRLPRPLKGVLRWASRYR